jgi:plastocyanin
MKTTIVSKSRNIIGITFLAIILTVSGGCYKKSSYNYGTPPPGGTKGPGANEVFIQGGVFNPPSITVTAGTTITWTNKDIYDHQPLSDTGGAFISGVLMPGGTYSFTFMTTGTYNYHDGVYPAITGKVIVN